MIETERLILRRWEARDRAAFAALNADPEVMRHFPKPLAPAESDAMIGRLKDRWTSDGIAFAAVEQRADRAFIGMVGLGQIHFALPGTPPGATEIGWRLARAYWGQGYATEAARAWLAYGYTVREAPEIVAFTVPANEASKAVMRRIGLRPDPARAFDHPLLAEGHPLRLHVVYALSRADWGAA